MYVRRERGGVDILQTVYGADITEFLPHQSRLVVLT